MIFISMKKITITCDRCGKIVNVTIGICSGTGAVITEGYYIVDEGNWQEFQRDDEEQICNDCMHSDPKYQSLFKIP